MRVIFPGKDVEKFQHAGTLRTPRQHAFDGMQNDLLWMLRKQARDWRTLEVSEVPTVTEIDFFCAFRSLENNTCGICDDDVLTLQEVWAEIPTVLSAQNRSDACCEPAERLPIRIDEVPSGFCRCDGITRAHVMQ